MIVYHSLIYYPLEYPLVHVPYISLYLQLVSAFTEK